MHMYTPQPLPVAVPYGNMGCSGGSREVSLIYSIDMGGLDTASSYPYIETVSTHVNFSTAACVLFQLSYTLFYAHCVLQAENIRACFICVMNSKEIQDQLS